MSRRKFAIIGDPIDHSLSPVMQKAAFDAANVDAQYDAIQTTPSELATKISWLRDSGFKGFNVTAPHKETALQYLDELDPLVSHVGAVNTVARSTGDLVGYNTDSEGFRQALARWGVSVAGRSVLVLGAGGSARAVVHVLLQLGARVTVANGHPLKAEKLRQTLGKQVIALPLTREIMLPAVKESDVVLNATSVGMGPLSDASPLPTDVEFLPGATVVDLVYGRQTPLLRRACGQGCQTFDGLEILVQQGASSFRIWTGLEPDLDIMREACRSRLQEVA